MSVSWQPQLTPEGEQVLVESIQRARQHLKQRFAETMRALDDLNACKAALDQALHRADQAVYRFERATGRKVIR